MRVLCADIGEQRTGVAFFDDAIGFVIPLDTLQVSSADVSGTLRLLLEKKDVQHLVVGLPLLPSGERGAQVQIVERVIAPLKDAGFRIWMQDERYSTPKTAPDPDASAACAILETFLAANRQKL